MSYCLFHRCLAAICDGPHCPGCGSSADGKCIEFVRRASHHPDWLTEATIQARQPRI